MPWVAVGSALAAIFGGAVAAREQRKARKLAMEKMRQDQINFEKSLELQKTTAEGQLKEAQRVHGENMTHLRNTLAADQQRFSQQFAQAERGLQLQVDRMQAEQARAAQALNNQKAQIERQINKDEALKVTHSRKKEDEGVSGTLLTGPMGVDKDKLKLGKKTLLGQ